MSSLLYKTRGNSTPQGKPRVFFACHPADFENAFELLSKDILELSNCAVWYETPCSSLGSAEFADDLSQMQLVVLAVTARFLEQPCRAADEVMPIALEKRIPILPIMLESGLEAAFNHRCGNYQIVSRVSSDATAIPYEERLGAYLGSVLIGDELAEAVRNAFDAYVFLSYRKKDRAHAQKLMRLIHANSQFRDIAIWYDEFLVPGEDFNDAIRDALQKSELIAFAVTPNLLECGNYVLTTEYPAAKQSGKDVLPVEMVRTDRDALCDNYPGIGAITDGQNKLELDEALIGALHKMAIQENDGSPLHRFFIGLAYLCGIDTEIDFHKARSLIEEASRDGLCAATQKLTDMYRTGEGVPRDQELALKWQKKLVAQRKTEFERSLSPDEHGGEGTKYFYSLINLSDMVREEGDTAGAEDAALIALRLCEELGDEVGIRETLRDTALVCNRLCGIYISCGRLDEAEKYGRRALTLNEKAAGEINTARARRDLSISYERLGNILRLKNDNKSALEHYERSRRIREELAADETDTRALSDLSAVLTKLGSVYKALGNIAAAECFARALKIDRSLAAQLKTTQSESDLAVSLIKYGDIHKADGENDEAAVLYNEAVSLCRKTEERTGTARARRERAAACEKLAGVYKRLKKADEAASLYREAVSLREKLAELDASSRAMHELAAAYYNYASFASDKDVMQKAYLIWDKLSKENPSQQDYAKYRDRTGTFAE